jgi:TolA-binding protein
MGSSCESDSYLHIPSHDHSNPVGILIAVECRMKGNFIRSILVLILSLFLICHSSKIGASPHPSGRKIYKGAISRIVSIKTHQSNDQTTVTVAGDGNISEYTAKTFKAPPRILVDIKCAARLLEATSVKVDNPDIKSIRIGYHFDRIRVVIDVKGDTVPAYKDKSKNNVLIITLKTKKIRDEKNQHRHPVRKERGKTPVKIKKSEKKKTDNIRTTASYLEEEKHISNKKNSLDPEVSNNPVHVPGQTKDPALPGKTSVKKQKAVDPSPGEKLARLVDDDGKEDTSFYLKCLNAYRSEDWQGAILNFKNFIKKYPNGRYTEKAYFILAKSYDQLQSRNISDHSNEIKDHYEDAISRFPASEFVPDAMYSIGDLLFNMKNYSEAMGYYNLVLKENKSPILQIKALTQKVKILILKKRKSEALSDLNQLEQITSKYPDLPERTESRKEKAKILYEMNQFDESMDILDKLIRENPENLYLYPEISLYLGYNYYQLGNNKKARENLYRFYNICPDREINDLVLNQIGDTYRNEGLVKDAVKFYRLVLDRFPNTDGAIISKIRLAEQQENTDWIEKTRKEVGSPQNIYESIVDHPGEKKGGKNPLIQLSMLKLGITYQKEKEYQKSLEVLKELLDRYPTTSLMRELTHALMVTLESIQQKEIKDKNYINIINLYLKEKKLFSMINAPELFLPVARAFAYVDLKDMAISLFKKADVLLSDTEKPDDLLFLMGKYFYESESIDEALNRFDILTQRYPHSEYLPEAYRMKGNILLKQKKYAQATDAFDNALKYPVTTCKKAHLLIKKASALVGEDLKERALNSINQANELKKDCDNGDFTIDKDIGDAYLSLGNAKKALDIFSSAVKKAKSDPDKVPLKLKLAKCYWLLNKKEDSLAVYHQISSLNDPFWSNLAKEKMDEIQFSRENNPKKAN